MPGTLNLNINKIWDVLKLLRNYSHKFTTESKHSIRFIDNSYLVTGLYLRIGTSSVVSMRHLPATAAGAGSVSHRTHNPWSESSSTNTLTLKSENWPWLMYKMDKLLSDHGECVWPSGEESLPDMIITTSVAISIYFKCRNFMKRISRKMNLNFYKMKLLLK